MSAKLTVIKEYIDIRDGADALDKELAIRESLLTANRQRNFANKCLCGWTEDDKWRQAFDEIWNQVMDRDLGPKILKCDEAEDYIEFLKCRKIKVSDQERIDLEWLLRLRFGIVPRVNSPTISNSDSDQGAGYNYDGLMPASPIDIKPLTIPEDDVVSQGDIFSLEDDYVSRDDVVSQESAEQSIFEFTQNGITLIFNQIGSAFQPKPT